VAAGADCAGAWAACDAAAIRISMGSIIVLPILSPA
jgi:hypothetical protein